MNQKYKIKVNSNLHFELTAKETLNIDSVVSSTTMHLLKDSTSYHVEISKCNFFEREYTVIVNGTSYEVAIENELDQLISEMGFASQTSKQINILKAPMPGLILEIHVEKGQEVKENESLLILEAMKMENNFLSPRSGIIKYIAVSKGDSVDKGQVLIEFE